MGRVPKKIQLARALRHQPAPAEAILWRALRNRALASFNFRRQHPIGPYVVDFACVACKIVVEADGVSHLPARSADQRRTQTLQAEGWRVMRFWNTEIYDELEAVTEAIYQACVGRSSPPSPLPLSPRGGRSCTGQRPRTAGGEGEDCARLS